MTTDLPFAESLPDVPPIKTGDKKLDALLVKLTGDNPAPAVKALKQAPRAVPHLLALLDALTNGVGPTEWNTKLAGKLGRSTIERGDALLQRLPISARMVDVRSVAEALLAHRDADPHIEKALIKIVATSSSLTLRYAAATPLLDAQSPAGLTALESLLGSFDGQFAVEIWLTTAAIHACLRRQPPTVAFDKLAARLDTAPEALLEALKYHKGEIDPRWFPLVAKFIDHKDAGLNIDAEYIFIDHPVPESIALIVKRIEDQPKAISPALFAILYKMKPKAAAVPLVTALEHSLKFTDWRLTNVVDRLIEIDNPEALPPLRALLERQQTPRAKRVIGAIVKHLARNEPAAPKPATAAKAKAKRASAQRSAPMQAVAARLSKAGLADEARIDELLAAARYRIELATTSAAAKPSGSRFGGIPDLPKGFAWPMHVEAVKTLEGKLVLGLDEYPKGTFPLEQDGKLHVPLAFVAQLDLAELAPLDAGGLLPKDGMLWFFVRDEIHIDARGDLPRLACHVEYRAKPGKLVATKPPPTLTKKLQFKEAAIKPALTATLAPSSVDHYRKLAVVGDEEEQYGVVWEAGEAKAPPHSALGWPRAAYFRGLPPKNHEVLLRVGSDSKPRMSWGDESAIFFCIPTRALGQRDFAATYCVADE